MIWRWFRRVVFGQWIEPSPHERLLSVIGRSRVEHVRREWRVVGNGKAAL